MTKEKTDASDLHREPDKTSGDKARDINKPAASKAAGPASATQDNSTYEEYLFGRGVMIDGAKGQAWSDTTKGRVMIRLVSRGVVGAAAWTLGNRYAGSQLRNYTEQNFDKSKPLQWVAKGFDTAFGKPIAAIIHFGAPKAKKAEWAEKAVWFRTKSYYHDVPGMNPGRSLGAEIVSVSFDFACASVGDAGTRNIIQAFDPNVQKPWIKDGKFDADAWVNSLGRSTWRVLTKNAGEDWAVALPYVYQMRWQRQTLAKYFEGFKLSSDQGWNGGSYKIERPSGSRQFHIGGDYQLAGAIDLQCRFVGYNWYTLMYRDAYDAVSRSFKNWQKNGYSFDVKLPENPLAATVGTVGHALRYAAKSWVKSNLYMQPATPFFWMFRTPQSKWKAGLVNPNGELGYDGYVTKLPLNKELGVRQDTAAHVVTLGGRENIASKVVKGQEIFLGEHGTLSHKFYNFDPYAIKNQKTIFGALLNPFGALSYHTGSWFSHYGEKLAQGSNSFKNFMGRTSWDREKLTRNFVDASFAYTPYMIAKAEFGLRVDDRPAGGGLGDMDKAIYGAIDSLVGFKFKDFGKYAKRVGVLMEDTTHKEVISREGTAKVTGDGSVIPHMSEDPATRVETSSIVSAHKDALLNKPDSQKNWKGYIADKREAAQLHPAHPTVQ